MHILVVQFKIIEVDSQSLNFKVLVSFLDKVLRATPLICQIVLFSLRPVIRHGFFTENSSKCCLRLLEIYDIFLLAVILCTHFGAEFKVTISSLI